MTDETIPLPEPAILCDCGGNYFTADQVRAAVMQERERCAKVCEAAGAGYDNEWNRKLGAADDLKEVAEECAAAIRSGHSITETTRAEE